MNVAASFLVAAVVLAASAGSADVVIPSSAFSSGQNAAEFHSDVRVFNPTNAPVIVTPIFYNQSSGETVAAPAPGTVTVPARGQVAFDNILASLFLQAKGAFGPIRFQTTAAIIVSSSVNNVNSCGNGATSGQWLPGIDAGQALKAGTLVQLAASADGASGYRSNVVFMNPGAAAANVTTSLRNGDGTLVAAFTLDPLPANGFKQIGTLSAWLPSPNTITDTNLWLEFTSDQAVLAFASVINNKSGDPFAIVMTAEPNVSAPAPVASYTVSASPATGQPVTFTDTSSNNPVNRFWAFGDGAIAATTTGTTTHTYAAPGTYKSALFVDNAGGSGSATKDVVVVTAGPTAITITGSSHGSTKWDWQPGLVTMKVGQPYVISFVADPFENLMHGIGGLAVLGITQCDLIPPQRACVVNFTPTSSMVGTWTYACTQTQCAPIKAVHDNMTGMITIVP
jgi:PKD repeat protein